MNRRHRIWRSKQTPETLERIRKQDEAMKIASTAFYCSWGHHRTFASSDTNEKFSKGTMCMECQMEIAENIRKSVFLPDMSAALWRKERDKFEAERNERRRLADLERKAPGVDVNGMVYYIRINGQIKIGYTSNLTQRSRNYPPGSELLAFEPGTRFTERERHQDFHRHLAKGREWFHEVPQITEHIASLVANYGVPDQLMHRYREHG